MRRKFLLCTDCPTQVNSVYLVTSARISKVPSSHVTDVHLLIHHSSKWHLAIDNSMRGRIQRTINDFYISITLMH